jgi:hypothetical protein
MNGSDEEPELKLLASYAYRERQRRENSFKLGERMVGQAALEKRTHSSDETCPRLREGQLPVWANRADEHRGAADSCSKAR